MTQFESAKNMIYIEKKSVFNNNRTLQQLSISITRQAQKHSLNEADTPFDLPDCWMETWPVSSADVCHKKRYPPNASKAKKINWPDSSRIAQRPTRRAQRVNDFGIVIMTFSCDGSIAGCLWGSVVWGLDFGPFSKLLLVVRSVLYAWS